jgi:hypothetical protein
MCRAELVATGNALPGWKLGAKKAGTVAMNDDNIRAEIERLKKSVQHESDSGIRRMFQHRLAQLENKLRNLKEAETK